MTIIPRCFDCKHLDRETPGMACAAFPAGIPDEIILAEHDHTEPFSGDNGIGFEAQNVGPGPGGAPADDERSSLG